MENGEYQMFQQENCQVLCNQSQGLLSLTRHIAEYCIPRRHFYNDTVTKPTSKSALRFGKTTMPFPFAPSTTSHLNFQASFISTTHPSLPSAATSQRNLLRSVLKSHKRLSVPDQANNLNSLISCLSEYLKYLNTIDSALSGKSISGEDVDIALTNEVEVEWRPTLVSASGPGREIERVKGRGLDYEIYFVHHAHAIIQDLLARQSLLGLYASVNPTTEQRLALIQNALKHLRTAYSIHTCLIQLASSSTDGPPAFPSAAVDIQPAVQAALQRLTAAEVNLLCVLKDDPYPAILIQSRNESDKEWMIKAPTIPKVRAQVITRLCVGAAEHAAAASATLKAEGRRVSKDLVEYVDDLRRTARARACRFQALDSDLGGATGKAIAWLYAGLNELGIEISVSKDGSSIKTSKLDKLKSSWNERREDKKIAKGNARWGMDAGKSEEVRILEYLERKMSKANNTINVQIVPEWRPLLATLPSGMNMPIEERWKVNLLSEDELAVMRSPPEKDELRADSSGEDEDDGGKGRVGAFPGTQEEYSGSSYY